MKPSKGLIASAVIAIGGSILSFLFGLMMIFTMFAAPVPSPERTPPAIPMGLIFGIMAGFYWGFGVWGIVSAIGLLRLRNWARICFAVFGAILAAFSLCGEFGVAMAAMMPQPALPPNVSPPLVAGFLAVFAVAALVFAALGIWWVIYFNRPRVKAQFMSEAAAAAPRLFPLSISIIAWFLIIGGVSPLFVFPFLPPFPMVLFGFVFRGLAGRMIAFLFAGISLFSGIGMLKKRAVANSVAIGYCVFALFNTVWFWIVPGSSARMQDAMREMPWGRDLQVDLSSAPSRLAMLLPAVAIVVALWFLITRRNAFLQERRSA